MLGQIMFVQMPPSIYIIPCVAVICRAISLIYPGIASYKQIKFLSTGFADITNLIDHQTAKLQL